MAKKTKNRRRGSALAAKAKPTLKQRILRRAFRVLPFVMNGIFIVGILVAVIVMGMLGWSALTENTGRKPNRTSNYRHETGRRPISRTVGDRMIVGPEYPLIQDDPIALLAEANRFNQQATRQNALGPTGQPTTPMEGTSSGRELMRYPMWDSQSRRMVERRVFMDGRQETVRPTHSPANQSFGVSPPSRTFAPPGINDVINQHLQGGLQNPVGMPSRQRDSPHGVR